MKTIKLEFGIYNLVSYNYIPLFDSAGTCCENCGRLISNIATISDSIGKHYIVGLDCAKTILDVKNYEDAKRGISKKKKQLEKIEWCKNNHKEYVVDENGYACHPPHTRSGYMIKF